MPVWRYGFFDFYNDKTISLIKLDSSAHYDGRDLFCVVPAIRKTARLQLGGSAGKKDRAHGWVCAACHLV